MPLLNSSSNCHLTDLHITGTVLFDDLTSISGAYGSNSFTHHDVTVDGQVIHPFKSPGTTSQLSKTSFMVYSGVDGFTNENTQEHFNTETYRIISGNYATQADVTHISNKWSPTTAMNNGGGHDDGMVSVNGYLITPKTIGNNGDTRNVADGGSLQAPSGNPNYSSLTNGTRTFYRYFSKNTLGSSTSITITLYGSGSLVKKSLALTDGGGHFYVEAKIPETTAWLDVGKSISGGPLVDGSGAGSGYSAGNPPITISTGGTSVSCNFLGTGLSSGEEIVLKISADEDWLGYLSQIVIGY